MPLLEYRKGGAPLLSAADSWIFVADDQPVPASGDVVVSLARLSDAALSGRSGKVGVRLESTDELDALIPQLAKVSLVAVNFPKFGDGRGYSKARLLRERHAFAGEIRAIGEVLSDQLFFMMRCGFDTFALLDGKDVQAALAAFKDFSVTYQAATDEARPLYRRVQR
jgi:uncharacterized protein (DUF934 family)